MAGQRRAERRQAPRGLRLRAGAEGRHPLRARRHRRPLGGRAEAARLTLPRTTPFTFAWDETFDVGQDTGTPVDDKDYQIPATFTGQFGTITIDLGDGPVSLASMTAWIKEISSRDAERPAAGVAPAKP